MKKFLIYILIPLFLVAPAFGTTTIGYGKGAGSAEIAYFHPSLSLCTKVGATSGSNDRWPLVRFDTMTSTGCKLILKGFVPNAAASSYVLTLRLFFTTLAETSKVVGLNVRSYAVVSSESSLAGPERTFSTPQVELTSGAARTFNANQIGFVEGSITIYSQGGSACNSDCNNKELILEIEPSSSMTISPGDFFLEGYDVRLATP